MFRRNKPKLSNSPTEYPIGSFIRTELGFFLIMPNFNRSKFTSVRAVDSYRPHRIINTTELAVLRYAIGLPLKFRNNSLLQNIADGKIYLIEQGKKRHIKDVDCLAKIGATRDDVVLVSENEIKLHEDGEPLI